jgi:hypothetical protein
MPTGIAAEVTSTVSDALVTVTVVTSLAAFVVVAPSAVIERLPPDEEMPTGPAEVTVHGAGGATAGVVGVVAVGVVVVVVGVVGVVVVAGVVVAGVVVAGVVVVSAVVGVVVVVAGVVVVVVGVVVVPAGSFVSFTRTIGPYDVAGGVLAVGVGAGSGVSTLGTDVAAVAKFDGSAPIESTTTGAVAFGVAFTAGFFAAAGAGGAKS